ncbi:MAG: metalloregulator ArsR/SmtB family transcription factor [Candidatus Bipolaricaulota bacterium]|nr:metalloregulator ArsR/SmtB family transcription factor [Candidatus Bipolaricaulota bacterium]MDW8152571.1 metalloregulator ArsR/SmtB family transcription factor [Candidatus Bipolaricaulota bacterium]
MHNDAINVPETSLIALGQALAHPARVRILILLAQKERCGCELAESLGLDPSVISRHLSLLAEAGLIVSRREGPRLLWRLSHSQVPLLLTCLAHLSCKKECL